MHDPENDENVFGCWSDDFLSPKEKTLREETPQEREERAQMLKTEIFGRTLRSPLILASGILGTTKSLLKRVGEMGAGAVTIKSISISPRSGHPNPVVLAFGPGMINAVGYSNPGLENACAEYADLSDVPCPVIGSLIGTQPEEFAVVASAFDKLDFAALEIPVSCPHTPGFGKMARQDTPEMVLTILKWVRANTTKPVFIKVPAAAQNLSELVAAAREGGACGITAVNTIGPGMLINIDARKPYLGFGIGGVSGPALKPLAVAATYAIAASCDIPIIGTGGVMTGEDALELIMAGAVGVGVGTAVIERGIEAFELIAREMADWMRARGVKNLDEIRGAAHAK
ncbi:MAG: dihydroorotate dehydrogenase [Candidatus Sumerlaeota bacterium]|nr:dihydroorotate dehydrogenase [Candidatus Sumerlaeota bacterium]